LSAPLADRVGDWLEATGLDGDGELLLAVPSPGGTRLHGSIEVRTEAQQVIVHLDAPWTVPPDRWPEAAAVVARLNWALPVGNLELNGAGDLRARASVDLEGVEVAPLARMLETLVLACQTALLEGIERVAAVIDGDDPGVLP
jgi:hypothetical protein